MLKYPIPKNHCFSYVFDAFAAFLSMYRYGHGIVRFLTTTARSNKFNWDPIVSLQLNHPSLVLLEKCHNRGHFKQILGQMMRSNLICQTFPMSRLIFFSAIAYPENLDIALILFDQFTPNANLYIYNTMISALSKVDSTRCFSVYNSMLCFGVDPDKHTLHSLLNAANYVSEVWQIHCHAIVLGLSTYGYLKNSLIKFYMENGLFWLARKVFEEMPPPDVVSFSVMITGYNKKGFFLEAVQLFREMLSLGLNPDDFTMLGLLVCYGQLGEARFGKAVHAWIERRKSVASSNIILGNALLDMYIKCQKLDLAQRIFYALKDKDAVSWNTMTIGCAKAGDLGLARTFFNQMPKRDLVSWNSLISGYAHHGDFPKVIELFNDMVAEKVEPDNVTMSSLVSAAAEIGALDQGRSAHGWVIRNQMKIDALLGSALIDMYCKCGSIERACSVFREINKKDVVAWTTMISGFAFHGYGSKAVELFHEMQQNVAPNEVTFISVLTACSHSGLIDQGLKIFNCMKEYGIEPRKEHYGCLVDLLGRSGRLVDAKNVIERMPVKPTISMWGSILNACRAQGDVEMAEIALIELLKLKPEEDGGYILLSNMHAANGRWGYSNNIRKTMESRGVTKTAGCSNVVVDGVNHEFRAADKRHPRWIDVELVLNYLTSELRLGVDSLQYMY